MKKSLLFSILTALTTIVWGQSVSLVTTYAGSSPNVVVGASAAHAIEAVYTNSEIGASNFVGSGNGITQIQFALNNTSTGTLPATIPNYSIYMKNVPSSVTTLATGTFSLTGYTLVYSGSLSLVSAGPQYSFTFSGGVTLTTPFERASGTNLQVLIIRSGGAAAPGYVFDCANGIEGDGNGATLSSRRYNGNTVVAENSTTLTASAFRPAIKLIRPVAIDASVTGFASLPSPTCFSTPQSVSVTLKNEGTTAIAPSAAQVKLEISGANSTTQTILNTTSLAAGATETIVFSGLNLNTAGTNNLKAYVTLAGDASTGNDTAKTSLSTTESYTSYPVSTSAEITDPLVFQYLKTLSGSNHWGLSLASPGTNTTTGAYKNADFSDSLRPHTGLDFYLYDSYSGSSSAGHRSVLYAGCFTFTAPANISFWMSQDPSYPSSDDSVYVVISGDGGNTWVRVGGGGFTRANTAFTAPGWVQKTVDLSLYANTTIHIGLEGVSKYGNIIGIDDIVVTGGAMPITLGEFTGKKENNKNILSWNTLSEMNNKGFELQRSANGSEFTTIAFIATKAENGTSSSEIKYSYSDKASVTNTYYRLKQIDKDGKTSYSGIVLIKGEKPNRFELVNIYPNPAKERLSVTVTAPKAVQATLTITDMTGKVVMQQNNQLAVGENNISINVAALNTGNYIIKLSCANGCESSVQKFIKQ
ncbi:MAG: T9SS type A sorting domain-containing protein [Chitinophagales bacterium]|nr:T9SS type A sorting domain-containing protein [Chitinophagales bacterium]